MQQQAPIEEGPRAFARTLELIADGTCHVELSEEQHDLLKKLHSHAMHTQGVAQGEITLKIKYRVEATGVVGLKYDVKVKEPTKLRPNAVMWITPGGNLTPQNPKQPELFPREVPKPAPARELPEESTPAARSV